MSDPIISHLQRLTDKVIAREVGHLQALDRAAAAFRGLAACSTCDICRHIGERGEAEILSYLDAIRTANHLG